LSLRLLLDANLPHQVAAALREVGIDAFAPGDAAGSGLPPVPAKDAEDELICTWCEQTDAVLITRDRGKSDPGMKIAVAQHPGIGYVYMARAARAPIEVLGAICIGIEGLKQSHRPTRPLRAAELSTHGNLTKAKRRLPSALATHRRRVVLVFHPRTKPGPAAAGLAATRVVSRTPLRIG
jgi:hypothetical protein